MQLKSEVKERACLQMPIFKLLFVRGLFFKLEDIYLPLSSQLLLYTVSGTTAESLDALWWALVGKTTSTE